MDRVNTVADQLTQEDLFVAVEPFFDDRKDVFGMDGDGTFFRGRFFLSHVVPFFLSIWIVFQAKIVTYIRFVKVSDLMASQKVHPLSVAASVQDFDIQHVCLHP
jgi:hypothetical protein